MSLKHASVSETQFSGWKAQANPDERRIDVKRSATWLFDWVSGQRPEQGAAAKFFAKQKTWAQGPYPAQ